MKQSQIPYELKKLTEIAKESKSFLEIGSRYGETLLHIGKELPEDSLIVSVELPNGPWGRSDSLPDLYHVADVLRYTYRHRVHLILGNSQDAGVVNQVKKVSESFDFILIDGDHTYEGVSSDWKNYGPMGKIVAFHDIAAEMKPSGTGHIMEVPRFWFDLKKEIDNYSEIIAQGSYMGIGVVWNA